MENKLEDNKPIGSENGNSHQGMSVFGQSSHFASLYKKTEKLIAAIYMITDFVRDNEPLKWRVREKALELLSLNIRFTTVSLSERRELLKKYQAISMEIVSLAGIAQMGGLISEMNCSILKREFEKLASTIENDENKKSNEETVILNPGFFEKNPQSAEGAPADVLYNQPQISKGHTPKPAPQRVEYLPKVSHIADTKNDRKAIITRLLSKNGGLNIKDFSQAIKDCSEKTIQRELLSMVSAGILKKEGERRWSTYSLAK